MTYTFQVKHGTTYEVAAKDADRARIVAKRKAGEDWKQAKLISISNKLVRMEVV